MHYKVWGGRGEVSRLERGFLALLAIKEYNSPAGFAYAHRTHLSVRVME